MNKQSDFALATVPTIAYSSFRGVYVPKPTPRRDGALAYQQIPSLMGSTRIYRDGRREST